VSTDDPSPALTKPVAGSLREERLPMRSILDLMAPTVGVGFMFFLVILYLMKFATDDLEIPAAFMGTVFGLSRLWDAVSDPVAGYLSDRTRTRFGRRRPWLLASALPVAAVFYLLWSPPRALSGGALELWMALGVFGFFSAMTIFVVPHTALAAEMTDSYHDRTRIFGTRHITWTLGSILALGGMYLLIVAEDSRGMALQVAAGVAGVTLVTMLWAFFRTRERSDFQGRGGTNPYASFRDVLRNPHARLLLGVFTIESLGGATIGILTPYIAQYIINREDLTVLFILSYLIASIAFVPIWLPLSRRFGKKRLWMFSMGVTAISFGGMFFLTEGAVILISVLAFTAGLAASCGAMMGPSIQADIIDFDEYGSGERKEGAYFAAWNFAYKSATGITLMLTGYVLALSGFVPNEVQTEQARFWMLALYSIFPLVCYVIGALMFSAFSLDEDEHRRIRHELDSRPSGDG